jgi:hypothetical protein
VYVGVILAIYTYIKGSGEMQYTQQDFLNIINKYNNMDRKNITINLSIIAKKVGIKNKQVIEDTGYTPYKVNSWFAVSSPNIPTFEDALMLAVKYNFDIEELIKE